MFKRFLALSLVLAVVFLQPVAGQRSNAQTKKNYAFKPTLHSISYAGIWRGHTALSVDEFLLKAKQLGFEAVVLVAKHPHVSPFAYDDAARARLRTRLKELNLELAALMGYVDFTAGMNHIGIPSAEINASHVATMAKLAQDLGTTRLRIFTGYEQQGVPYDQQYGELVKGLKLSAREAAKYGITLLVQNHHDIASHHDQMAWLLHEVNEPNVKAAFDAWTPTLEGLRGKELEEAVKKMAPYIAFTTVADYVKQKRYRYEIPLVNFVRQEPDLVRAVPVGEGIVDYPSFFKALKDIGYKGYVAYEMCEVLDGGGSMENLDRTAKKFLEYMKEVGE